MRTTIPVENHSTLGNPINSAVQQKLVTLAKNLEISLIEEVASPCINVCVIDECTGFCAGCLRSLDEIAGWSRFTDDDKREVLVRVEVRRKTAHQAQAGGA